MNIEHVPEREAKHRARGNIDCKLVTDLELANILSCSRTTIWRRVKDHSLPAPLRIGGLTRWVLAEVEAAIARQIAARDGEAA